jgi:hypothetical protein
MQSMQTQQNYVQGINDCQVNPMQRSADAEQQYLAGVQDAVQSGRRKAALLATPVSSWKSGATGKGAGRITSGAQAAAGKVQAHFAKFGPVYDSISAHCATMPSGGMANALAKVQYAMTQLKQAAGKTVN